MCETPSVKYAVVGREVGESGTPHLQGAIQYKSPYDAFSWAQKAFNKRMSIKPRYFKSTDYAAAVYCMKDEDIFEVGTRPKPGERTDLKDIYELMDEYGNDLTKIRSHNPTLQQWQLAEKIARWTDPPEKRNWYPEVYWYWGESGCGKTEQASLEAGVDAYYATEGGKWFEGYKGQENIVIDEFDCKEWPFRKLLMFLGNKPMKLPVRYGHVENLAKKIWITSEKEPLGMYEKQGNTFQLFRRIKEIKIFNELHPSLDEKWQRYQEYMYGGSSLI